MIALVGRRMHQYVLDEIELGKRVALCLLAENAWGLTAADDLHGRALRVINNLPEGD